jgi:hypothetical protein
MFPLSLVSHGRSTNGPSLDVPYILIRDLKLSLKGKEGSLTKFPCLPESQVRSFYYFCRNGQCVGG